MAYTLTNLVLVTVASLTSVRASAQWTVTELRPLNAVQSSALAIDGATQGGYARIDGTAGACMWSGTADTWFSLNPTGLWQGSIVFGIRDNQQVGYTYGDHYAALWSGSADTWVNLNPQGATWSQANAVANGVQVGQSRFSTGLRAGLWTGSAASWVDLQPADAQDSGAYAINEGQQVGYVRFSDVQRACIWSGSAESWIDLHPGNQDGSVAMGVYQGEQVGYTVVSGVTRANLWHGTAASWLDITPAQANLAAAVAVFDGMQVGYARINGEIHAGFWTGTAASWTDLHQFLPASDHRSVANGIWADQHFVYVVGSASSETQGIADRAVMWRMQRPCAADIGQQGGVPGSDGVLDNNDFIIYIANFFSHIPSADRGRQGGVRGADGLFDNNDFIVFIDQFFEGC